MFSSKSETCRSFVRPEGHLQLGGHRSGPSLGAAGPSLEAVGPSLGSAGPSLGAAGPQALRGSEELGFGHSRIALDWWIGKIPFAFS